VLTYVIGSVIERTVGFRLSEEDEVEGIDSVEHAESAYDFATAGGGGRAHAVPSVLARPSGRVDPEPRKVDA
jgi:ammonium transporter, Amt family